MKCRACFGRRLNVFLTWLFLLGMAYALWLLSGAVLDPGDKHPLAHQALFTVLAFLILVKPLGTVLFWILDGILFLLRPFMALWRRMRATREEDKGLWFCPKCFSDASLRATLDSQGPPFVCVCLPEPRGPSIHEINRDRYKPGEG